LRGFGRDVAGNIGARRPRQTRRRHSLFRGWRDFARDKDLRDLPLVFVVLVLLRFSEWWLRRKWGIV
jgi:hypothetical protein